MKIRFICFYFVLSSLLFACKQDTSNTSDHSNNAIENNSPVAVTDSLKEVFEAKVQAKENSLPLRYVSESGKVNPVDEAPLDTAFFVFRESLIENVQNKDLISFLSKANENMKVSFGDPLEGPAGFVELWGLDSPAKIAASEVWKHLKTVLQLGGQFSADKKMFTAPYVYSAFPDQYDAFEHGAIVGTGVRMRTHPSLNSKIVKSLSYDIVKVVEVVHDKLETIGGETHPWVKVQIPDTEITGFIYGKYLRSPIDYRIGFEQVGTEWQISFFVAGD